MTTTKRKTAAATPDKMPRTIKCPWDVAHRIAASADGSLVVVSGQIAQLAALDTGTWSLLPWPKLGNGGFSTNRLDVLPDGRLVAVSVAGGKLGVEIRDRGGAVTGWIRTPRNARAQWAPDGDLLVAAIEPDVKHERAAIALLDPRAGSYRAIDTVPIDGAAVGFVGGGETALAFVRTLEENIREQYRFLRIDRAGRVKDLGATDLWDAPASVTAVGDDRALVCSVNRGWRLIRTDTLEALAKSDYRFAVNAGCVHPGGFVVANGTDIRCHDRAGRLRAKKKAKARVSGLAVAGDVLLVQEGVGPARIELIPL